MSALARVVTMWPRALLHVGVIVVALSVLGMHQLSVDHTVPTLGPSHIHEDAALVAVAPATWPTQADEELTAAWTTVASPLHQGSEQPCSGCGHDPLVMTCLLALTLLVITWLLR